MKRSELKDVMSKLHDLGQIKYDHTITKEIFYDLLGTFPSDDWQYLGPLLLIKSHIEEKGYFCRIVEHNLYIYSADDNHKVCEKKNNNVVAKQKRWARAMLNTDTNELSQATQKKHLHALNLAVELCNQTNSLLIGYLGVLRKEEEIEYDEDREDSDRDFEEN